MVLTAFFLLVAIFKENSHTFYSTMTIVGYEEQVKKKKKEKNKPVQLTLYNLKQG